MSKKRKQKQKRKWRYKKARDIGRSYRAVIISDITEEGFDMKFKGRHYHIVRDVFAWFLGATGEELKSTQLISGGDPDDHGEYAVEWTLLDVLLGSNDFENPASVYRSANADRDKYYSAHPEKSRQNRNEMQQSVEVPPIIRYLIIGKV